MDRELGNKMVIVRCIDPSPAIVPLVCAFVGELPMKQCESHYYYAARSMA